MRISGIRAGLPLGPAGLTAVALAAGPAMASSTVAVPCSTSALGDEGGAIYNESTALVKYSTFSYNQSSSSSEYGGALANASFLAVAGSSLKGNSAPYGGAVYNEATLSLSGDSLSGNTAQYGAGLYTEDLATISTTTFQQNTASSAGGGIYNGTSDGVNLTASQVTYNHAPAGEGGGIYNEGDVVLGSTTVRFNAANNCSPALSVTGCTG
jgi:predicted outer membrane repeat protein